MDVTPTRLRQIALVVEDLPRAERLLTKVLQTEVVFRDPRVAQWGLKNLLVPIGGDIIEVVSPFRDGTTGGRLLRKRGDGGYMIIMQNLDAKARRDYIEGKGLSKVIFSHMDDESACIQYHPKGIPGGMMPELDSHKPSPENRTPLLSPFSPWHACGEDYPKYSAAMSRCSHLQLLKATCRLAPGENDTEVAAGAWEHIFGVRREGSELVFTNMRLEFVRGVDQRPEGLQSVTIGVKGTERYQDVLRMAREEGADNDGRVVFCGVEWVFVPLEGGDQTRSKM